MDREYLAFISYRHKPLDIAVAAKLHQLIERYKPPRALQKKSKHVYVFRDREELPVSSNLSADICRALDHSEFLIVVCTPDTPKSMWVQREIEYFLSKHDYTHVLVVLASGDPEEAFPRSLTNPFADDPQRRIEPLAADVRDKDTRHTVRKLKREFLRLYAGLLGVPYDSLVRREHKRRQRRLVIVASTALIVMLGYAGILLHSNRQISKKNVELAEANEQITTQNLELEDANRRITEQKEALEAANQTLKTQKLDLQRNESRLLVESARAAMNRKEYSLAFAEASAALPQDIEDTRPYYPAAEAALMDWLDVFDDMKQKDYKLTSSLSQETRIIRFRVTSDGQRAYTVDPFGAVICFNLQTREEDWRTDLPFNPNRSKEELDFILSEANGMLFIATNLTQPDRHFNREEVVALDSVTGEVLWRFDANDVFSSELALSPDESRLVLLAHCLGYTESFYNCFFLNARTGEFETRYWFGGSEGKPNTDLKLYNSNEIVFMEDDPSRVVGVYYQEIGDGEGWSRHFYTIDLEQGSIEDIYSDRRPAMDWMRTMRCRDGKLLAICDGQDENCAAELLCIDVENGVMKWSAETPQPEENVYSYGPYWRTRPFCALFDDTCRRILIGRQKNLYVYDMETGTILAENTPAFSHAINSLHPVSEGVYGFILENGDGRIGRLTEKGFEYAYGSIGIEEPEDSLSWNGGLQYGTLNGDTIEHKNGGGSVIYIPKTNNRQLRITKWYTRNAAWPCRQIWPENESIYMIPVSPEEIIHATGETISFVTRLFERENHTFRHNFITLNIHTLETSKMTFCTWKDLKEDGGRIIPIADGSGLLIDAGDGDLLFYDAKKDMLEALYGTTEGYLMDKDKSRTQGQLYGVGTYALAARRAIDGAAIGSICENGMLHLWKDGRSMPEVKLPEDVIWQRSIDSGSYRILMVGSNGYILLSDFADGKSGNELKRFACYQPLTGEWSFIDDEARGRSDRVLTMANMASILAVVDEERLLRIYDIESEKCLSRLSLPVASDAVRSIGFSEDDRYLFVVTQLYDNQVFVYRMSDGVLVYRQSLSNIETPVTIKEDLEASRLYIMCGTVSSASGYCVDTRSWTLLAEMENHPNAVVPEISCALVYSFDNGMCLQRIPTTLDIVHEAQAIATDMEQY